MAGAGQWAAKFAAVCHTGPWAHETQIGQGAHVRSVRDAFGFVERGAAGGSTAGATLFEQSGGREIICLQRVSNATLVGLISLCEI